jgi:hypothetical protein
MTAPLREPYRAPVDRSVTRAPAPPLVPLSDADQRSNQLTDALLDGVLTPHQAARRFGTDTRQLGPEPQIDPAERDARIARINQAVAQGKLFQPDAMATIREMEGGPSADENPAVAVGTGDQ